MRKNKLRILLMLSLLVSIVGLAPLYAEDEKPQNGFGVSLGPSIVRLSGEAGESQSALVRVWNKSQNKMQFTVEVSDIGNKIDERGWLARTYSPPGLLPYSSAKWILLNEKEFVLEPDTYKDYNFLVTAPQDFQGGASSVLFFKGITLAPPKKAEAAPDQAVTTLRISPRLGVLVFYEVEGTVNRTGEISDFDVVMPSGSDELTMRYTFENKGNADILVSGTFYILDQNKALAAKDSLSTIRTFPGDKGMGETKWQGYLTPGTYHLVASFELGPNTEEVIVREFDFTVQ